MEPSASDLFQIQNIPVIIMKGTYLDQTMSEFLSRETQILLNAGHSILILDFSRVHMISSRGIGMLVALYQKVRQRQGRLCLIGVVPMLFSAFKTAGVDALLEIHLTAQSQPL